MPDLSPLLALMAQDGYGAYVPYAVLAFFAASIAQTVVPPPAPGSHWLPVYRILSLLAANFGYAKNSNVPELSTWVGRVLSPLAPAILAAVEADKPVVKASSPVPTAPPENPPAPPPAA